MDKLIEDIDRVVNLLNVLKSRYFFLRSKYNIDFNSHNAHVSKDLQTEYQYASNDLQSCIMLELHLLEYACTYGKYSMNMFGTRLRTNLIENDNDQHFLKLLKNNVQSLIETNKEIADLQTDSYSSFHEYINVFMINTNILNGINMSNIGLLDETDVKKKKDKLAKKILKINLMANIISFYVSDKITDYRTDNGRVALNMALKYRTPRSFEYYTNKVKSNEVNSNN